MSYLAIAKYVAIAALVAFVTWATIDRFRLAGVVSAGRRCEVAAKTADRTLGDCSATIGDRVEAARRAAVCEAALAGNDLYAIRASCGAQVKLVHAKAVAAIADAADLKQQLAQAATDRDAAVQRAEARATSAADRTAANAKTIATAPRRADGRVHCAADCLRAIAGD